MGLFRQVIVGACRQALLHHTNLASAARASAALPWVTAAERQHQLSKLWVPYHSNICDHDMNTGGTRRQYATTFSEVTDPQLIRDFAIIGELAQWCCNDPPDSTTVDSLGYCLLQLFCLLQLLVVAATVMHCRGALCMW